ncbi:glycosyl transferase [Halovivax ruber XH-70]|uniref:Glycosyl transferase n=1 Tax=Halovivax ruber (strain DSM 18193 / JCM 13892 / XH-70) TaxID=797302 RepID=L0I9V9_HALRX|nr:glycosyltransferase [Halovivax ruber]AGB15613.1 glycosyl transferase [Halovivax ruber XH-70]
MLSDGIEVAMPTAESAGVLGGTLRALATSSDTSNVPITRLVIVDDESDDETAEIAAARADEYGWDLRFIARPTTLPEARELAVATVESDWFLFLDDDVRLSATYLARLRDAVSPAVGAVQGRKLSRDERNSDWVRRRARRGGTHATLCRHAAVAGVSFPPDLVVLEDEYLRRHVEDGGYLWVFNHQARFDHAAQDRHPIGWREGVLAGKYGLKPFHECALNVPFAAVSGRDPIPHAKRAAGWVAGRLRDSGEPRSPGDRSTTEPTSIEVTHEK